MHEKTPLIRNPLTIIAVFAGLSEVSMTVGLGLVPANLQSTFIWFVILFPTLLVILFFITLNFNHKVLYSPSDYKDEANFFRRFGGLLPEELEIRRTQAATEAQSTESQVQEDSDPVAQSSAQDTPQNDEPIQFNPKEPDASSFNSLRIGYNESSFSSMLAAIEKSALIQLGKRYNAEVEQEVAFNQNLKRIFFDGILRSPERFSLVEIKYSRLGLIRQESIITALHSFRSVYGELPDSQKKIFRPILVIVSETGNQHLKTSEFLFKQINKGNYPYPIQIETFKREDLTATPHGV